MEQNGKSLSMHNKAIWKGTYDDNGMLLKIHENCYTIGYSALLSPDEQSAGKVYFGDGVFYDAHQKNNKVHAGAPTVSNAVPKFAGIVVREPAIASGLLNSGLMTVAKPRPTRPNRPLPTFSRQVRTHWLHRMHLPWSRSMPTRRCSLKDSCLLPSKRLGWISCWLA